jgi:hypothetical protein
MAREAPLAVIFRRGPSKWVQIIKWATRTDSFEAGQWFHGRIYERRCDLSPDGKLIVYFASNQDRRQRSSSYTATWTAVSKLPWITALALWPKGDCWAGGGMFRDDRTVLLNHDDAKPHPDHDPGSRLNVLVEHYRGEDGPLFDQRLRRDGWVQECVGGWTQLPKWPPRADPPEVWSKPHPRKPLQLVRRLSGFFQRRGSVIRIYNESFALRRQDQTLEVPLPDAEWAEWDQRGRLVFARGGCLLTASVNKDGNLAETVLADFNAAQPVRTPSPERARHW